MTQLHAVMDDVSHGSAGAGVGPRRYRRAARMAVHRSMMMVWVVTPLLPAIGAVISWCLGL